MPIPGGVRGFPFSPVTIDPALSSALQSAGEDLVQAVEVEVQRTPGDAERRDLAFAWKVCKHVKSNAIVLAKEGMVVGIENAGRIFDAAKHPKSFVSLAGADHLLSRREDAAYVANVITAWAERYLDMPMPMDNLEADPDGGGEVGDRAAKPTADLVTEQSRPPQEPRTEFRCSFEDRNGT